MDRKRRPRSLPTAPLIDYVKNEWKYNPKYGQSHSEDIQIGAWGRRLGAVSAMIRAPRLRRYVFVHLVLLAIFLLAYKAWLKPHWEEQSILSADVDRLLQEQDGRRFGTNARVGFSDIVHIKTLDEKLLPRAGRDRADKARRLIFIGDVHGCKAELSSLLDKVHFSQDTDHLIFTGDMIAKGPDSGGVVDMAQQLGASCVRGNHEDRVLLAYKDLKSHHVRHPNGKPEEDSVQDNARGDLKDRGVARNLTDDQVQYLSQCPVILKVGEIPGLGHVVVVHGGLVPGLRLEQQDPFYVMNMRTIDLETLVPSDGRDGVNWTKLWNYYQSSLTKKDRTTVIYGHDSKVGLNVRKYSKGLDSGCVSGGKLSALIVEAGYFGASTSLVSVPGTNYAALRRAQQLGGLDPDMGMH